MAQSDSVHLQGCSPPAPLAGLGNGYRSLFVLGRGGMGRVEVALEQGHGAPERVVALKRILPESALDPRRKEMFLREARLGALLEHPNVVRAFAYGEMGGELFLAMEYVEGEALSRVLGSLRDAGRRLDVRVACRLLAEVCEGLHAAHELTGPDGKALNVVHRDVSPHNVMIAYDGRVKLLDFGVAKLDAVEVQTRTGEVKGKMAYMSPEQALGDRLDRRSDLFSVGAVLFECITGRPMWGTGTDVELMRKLALQQPPALDPRTYNVPPRLASLHARLVARDPATRPGSANEVARELRELAGATDVTESSAELRSLMTDLFADAAADRRVTLARSLDREAPSRAEDLRRNLAPGTEVGGAVAGDRPGLNAPRRHLRRTAVAAAAIAAIVATAVVEAGAMRAPSRIKPTPAPNVEVDVAVPATAVRDPAPIVVQGPTTGNVTTDPSPPVPRVARSTASAPIPAPARHVAGKPAPTHASDVDPTPF